MANLHIPDGYRTGFENAQSPDLEQTPELERAFHTLVEDWRKEALGLSRIDKKVMHPAYQEIISMGPQVIPLILGELRDQPTYWFEALRSISHEDPAHSAQSFDEAKDAWLSWGQAHQYMR